MTRKIITTILTTIVLSMILNIGSTFAYSIDPSYAPNNTPYDFDVEAKGAEGSTILLLQIIAGALLFFAAPLTVIMIAWASLDMVMGGAESEKLEQAKKHMTWSIIGLILIIISYSAVRFVIKLAVDSADVPVDTAAEQPAEVEPETP